MSTIRTTAACLVTSLALAPLASAQITESDILSWEDSDSLIETLWGPVLGPVDEHEIHLIAVQAANDILPVIGDEYDFIGFWMNFQPAPWWPTNGRAATYGPIRNDVTGLGSFAGTEPDGTYDFHDDYGLAGSNLQGLMFLTNINAPGWSSDPAHPVDSLKTSLNINHEYMHRFGIYLPDLLDGRQLQGEPIIDPFDDYPCGTATHWNRRVDGQGSSVSLQEWIGSAPAVLGKSYSSGQLVVNTDITDGHFSYLDLYLMGMVSAAGADAGLSELRYMDDNGDCSSPYFGAISNFTMADIVAAAGARVPDSSASQKDFKTAWVIIHKPGDPPDAAEKQKLIGILEKQQAEWSASTLGLSTMSHALEPVAWAGHGSALAGIAGAPVLLGSGPLSAGSSNAVDLSSAAPSATAGLFLALASTPVPFKGGTLMPFPFFDPVLVTTSAAGTISIPFVMPAGVPPGTELWLQWAIQDAAAVQGVALSNGLRGTTP